MWDAMLLALKMREGAMVKEGEEPLELVKARKQILHSNIPKKHRPHTLTSGQKYLYNLSQCGN